MKKLLLLGFVIIILGSCINKSEQQAKSSGMEIFFEKTNHDYGDVLVDSDGTCKFEFKNIGEYPLLINKVRSSCGCTIPSWPKRPIEAGKSGEIAVRYNTAVAGSFMKTIIVYSSAVNSPVKLVVRGKVVEGEEEKRRVGEEKKYKEAM